MIFINDAVSHVLNFIWSELDCWMINWLQCLAQNPFKDWVYLIDVRIS